MLGFLPLASAPLGDDGGLVTVWGNIVPVPGTAWTELDPDAINIWTAVDPTPPTLWTPVAA